MSVIATLTSRLLSWMQGIQEMDNSLKLHTVDPAHQSQKVLHDLDNFPTNNMNEIKEFFKGARPISDGGKVFMKIKASFKTPVDELLHAQWYSPLLQMLKEDGFGTFFMTAISNQMIWIVSYAFVDDTDLIQTA